MRRFLLGFSFVLVPVVVNAKENITIFCSNMTNAAACGVSYEQTISDIDGASHWTMWTTCGGNTTMTSGPGFQSTTSTAQCYDV